MKVGPYMAEKTTQILAFATQLHHFTWWKLGHHTARLQLHIHYCLISASFVMVYIPCSRL